jgi:hypothetical protein
MMASDPCGGSLIQSSLNQLAVTLQTQAFLTAYLSDPEVLRTNSVTSHPP